MIINFLKSYGLLILIFLFSCGINRKISHSGLVLFKHRFYDSAGNEQLIKYMEKDISVWFKDSCVIYEVNSINLFRENGIEKPWNTTTVKYTYLDLRTMVYSDYRSFTDTATLIRSYTLPDTAIVVWNFFGTKGIIPSNEPYFQLTDTLINNVTYKRFSGKFYFNSDTTTEKTSFMYYMLCNPQKNIFHIHRSFDDRVNIGCNSSRFDFYMADRNKYLSSQYEIVRQSLSDTEKKVFAKWSENNKTAKPEFLESAPID